MSWWRVPKRSLLRRVRRVFRRLLAAALVTSLSVAAFVMVAVFAFPYPVSTLAPDRGGPLVLVDRYGTPLRSVPDPRGRPGREAWVPLEDIPAPVIRTVLASEDERFFDHGGVDPWAVLRAALLNLREGRVGYGASTLTMQLARMVHSRGAPRTFWNKVRESVIALRMERAMDKRAILEQYLNRAYYGRGAYGIEAAARLYFDKPAASLSVGEATLLAVVPRAPGAYDPVRHLARVERRRAHVFGLLVEDGHMTESEVLRAEAEPLEPGIYRPAFEAPHFTAHVLASLPASVRLRGGTVHTTLDLGLGHVLEERVAAHVASLSGRTLAQAGVLVLDATTGEVRAMVGSRSFAGEDGQINITTWRRHPGSALKPFVYAAAIEAGESPVSVAYDVFDVPSAYHLSGTPPVEHGPVRFREALAGSYNLAAVHVLEEVGVPTVMTLLRRAAVAPLEGGADDYGLRLALGSPKVRLVDLAAAYRFLAYGGRVLGHASVRRVVRGDGSVWRPERAAERQVVSPETAWLVMDMLADPDARAPEFGRETPFDLPFRVAAKTGTARGFADTVAVGVTEQAIVAAWAGNFDGQPTEGLVAIESAAPLVRAGMLAVAQGHALTLPGRPPGLTRVTVCPLSGKLAGPACPHRKVDYVRAGRGPRQACDWHRRQGGRVVVRAPPELAGWMRRTGRGPRLGPGADST